MSKDSQTTRYKLTLEYCGKDYAGWQSQEPHGPATIQASLETAIYGFCKQKVTTVVAGRTDAGVHARGQVAHVDLAPFTKPMTCYEITKAINAHLRPAPIAVIQTEEVDGDFNARFDAFNKLYIYRILNRNAPPTLDRDHVWHIRRSLNITAMRDATPILLGQHDFTTFRDSECQAKNPVRTLDRIDIQSFEHANDGGQDIFIEVEAQSFLHHMVRNIVGTLLLVGEGKWNQDDLCRARDACDRTKGGPTAPACGLTLVRVDYDR